MPFAIRKQILKKILVDMKICRKIENLSNIDCLFSGIPLCASEMFVNYNDDNDFDFNFIHLTHFDLSMMQITLGITFIN